jgi:hypothetical protein
MSFLAQKRSKVFLDTAKVVPLNRTNLSDFYYKELATMTGSGGWSINFKEKSSTLDYEARKILRLPPSYKTTPKGALSFYVKKHQNKAMSLFLKCSKGTPFKTTIKMVRYDKKKFWAKAIGKPIFDNSGVVIGVQGVFQDVTKEVKQKKKLKKTKELVTKQNEQIINFSKIISHNLKSQAGNLEMTLELLKYTDDISEKKELNGNISTISSSLNETLVQLNELLIIQHKAKLPKQKIKFSQVLAKIHKEYQEAIEEYGVEIYSDFSEVIDIKYIPSFLENIFRKLISNSIKYRSQERALGLDIFTFKENGKKCLLFKDNGVGISSTKVNSIFNLYTKEENPENELKTSLFVLKNQIEALNGSITATSVEGQGTTFKILF